MQHVQCASSDAGSLRKHLKTHSGEKTHKCYQCDYASSQAGNLRTHLTNHSGEKPNKCNQCDYACHDTSNMQKHKSHRVETKQINAISVTMHPLELAI